MIPGLLIGLLAADVSGGTFTESQVIERVLKESPRLKAREYQVEEAQALTAVAGRWNNPQLRISGLRYDRLVAPAIHRKSYGDHPFEKASFGLRWSPTELGQRGSRVGEARVEEAAAKAERMETRRDTVALVRELFAEVVNLEKQIALAESMVSQRGKWRDLVRSRVKQQAATRLDQSLVDVEYLNAIASLNEIEIRYRQSYDALVVHAALPPDDKVRFVSDGNDACKVGQETEGLLRQAEKVNPKVGIVEAEILAADANRHRHWLGLFPWPDFLQLSYVMADDNSPSYFTFQLGISLPLFDWKIADRRADDAKGKRWAEKLRAEHQALSARIRQVVSLQQAQAALARRYQESAGVIDEGLTAVRRSLEAGETTGMVQILQLQSRLLAAEKASLKAQLECKRGQIELDRLTGSDP